MPDPILPDIFKCQVVMEGTSGLPEDVFINNWYFRSDDVQGVGYDPPGAIKRVLDSFYMTPSPAGIRIDNYLSKGIKRQLKYRVYDLGQAPPRTRDERLSGTMLSVSANSMPYEDALCLSFYAGLNRPRRRGRIYLGPLNVQALNPGPSTAYPTPDPQLLACIADRAAAVGRTTENVTWVMVTKGGMKPPVEPAGAKVITAGWVDNAWDHQRRRGLAATARTPFSAV